MVQNAGKTTYVSGVEGRPLPKVDTSARRGTHQPQKPKPTGLDWSKHRAPDAVDVIATPAAAVGADATSYVEEHPDNLAKRFEAPTEPTSLPDVDELDHDELREELYPGLTEREVARISEPIATLTPRAVTGSVTLPPARGPVDALVEHVGGILIRGHRHDDPLVQLLYANALSALTALDMATSSPAAAAEPPAPTASPAVVERPPRRTPRPRETTTVDVDQLRRLVVDEGLTCPAAANKLGVNPQTVRNACRRAGIEVPDGRAIASGGKPKSADDDHPETVALLRRLYVDEQLTIEEIAERTHHGRKLVSNVLRRAGVVMRPSAAVGTVLTDNMREAIVVAYRGGRPVLDLARDYHVNSRRIREILTDAGVEFADKGAGSRRRKAQLEDLGVTAFEIKTWAVAAGLVDEVRKGLVPGTLVDAYVAAHQPAEVGA